MRVARAFVVLFLAVLAGPVTAFGQKNEYERTFPQPKSAVEQALKKLHTSGRLPTLDGFAEIGAQPGDRFQRPFYECAVRVSSSTGGATVVRVAAKITAWYNDPAGAKSGYELLHSNGRLETDLLDQLADALGTTAAVTHPPTKSPDAPPPTISAPTPQRPDDLFSRSLSGITRSQARLGLPNEQSTDARVQQLRKEAQSLQDILNNQSHPNNLVAVKNSATPILAFPRMDSKVLLYASAQDEFEILDLTSDWVHVRISGLSRGWIRRSQLEMPDAIGDNGSEAAAASASDSAEQFRVTSEETAPFPGSWEPLRGKTVKIISVQRPDQMVSNPQMKLAYAKAVLEKEYPELSHNAPSLAGVMVIFDSADGGMMAATLANLQQWKAGALSDDALWDKCYFDPPETFAHNSTANR